jgi:hypothetical protein
MGFFLPSLPIKNRCFMAELTGDSWLFQGPTPAVRNEIIKLNFLSYTQFSGDSDDYGSAISEDRTLNEKYTELKRQSFFLRSSNQFYQTEVVGDSKRDPDYFVGEDSDSAFVTELRNPTSGAGFYIVRALDSTSTYVISIMLAANV